MIKHKIEIKGKTISVCKIEEQNERISTLKNSYKTYKFNDIKLKQFLILMIELKQNFETELLKSNIKLNELKKYLNKI